MKPFRESCATGLAPQDVQNHLHRHGYVLIRNLIPLTFRPTLDEALAETDSSQRMRTRYAGILTQPGSQMAVEDHAELPQ